MSDPVQSLALQSLPANDAAPASGPAAKKTPEPADDPSQQPVRLVVEPTHGGQSYTYRLYDRATGALLIELPREEAVKLGQSPDYSAGQVLNTAV
jgi:hypothetical protein